jgi:hypothetical protein
LRPRVQAIPKLSAAGAPPRRGRAVARARARRPQSARAGRARSSSRAGKVHQSRATSARGCASVFLFCGATPRSRACSHARSRARLAFANFTQEPRCVAIGRAPLARSHVRARAHARWPTTGALQQQSLYSSSRHGGIGYVALAPPLPTDRCATALPRAGPPPCFGVQFRRRHLAGIVILVNFPWKQHTHNKGSERFAKWHSRRRQRSW